MSNNADKLNQFLKALYDVEDPTYKVLVADPGGTPEVTIVNPIDLNLGVIADLLEWNRLLTITFLKQLFFDQTQGKFLDLIAHDHFGLIRASGESDSVYIDRVKNIILGRKISPASIIVNTTPYSSPNPPIIIEGDQEQMYADVSFTEYYQDSFQVLISTSAKYPVGDWVLPAIAFSFDAGAFFFILILEIIDSNDLPAVIDIVDRHIAAGIDYEIWIRT